MNIFFHHVGQDGADRDFPKTIQTKVQLKKLIADKAIKDPELIKKLEQAFPSGEFNCWGVPQGAKSVITNLKNGDYVFLVESSRINGMVSALSPVKLFEKYEMRALSEYLWQDSKFPYIFFFDTVNIELMWIQFLEDMGYKENFSPRGNFYKIDNKRFDKFGGAIEYISNILNSYSRYLGEDTITYILNEDIEEYALLNTQYEEGKLVALAKDAPILKDLFPSKRTVKISSREKAFRILVKKNYDYKCAICDVSLKSPTGIPAIHASHIYPKNQNGNDDLRNGICLCFLHHWAFDSGWLSIDDDYRILIRDYIPKTKEYENIYRFKEKKINLPKDSRFWPHPLFLSASRVFYGF
ncbi:HNH endonuclease [Pedobacter chitinilyticus]|uniref:HNH nuclease domain-containing protein n=1 Tax=Pedobacter chitinilyticus TaxID=2233776 RepID=A0A443Z1K6_9SPHI|nr:HNH endonuclease [Pedobacter chitinilyticus]RWU10402.1 hypothetical protein DPV69_03415 [Pedobacter chitinilyticus]